MAGLGIPAAAGLRVRAFARVEFWNEKPPAEWTRDEIRRLLNQSPWARQSTLMIAGAPGGALADLSRGAPGSGTNTQAAGRATPIGGGAGMSSPPEIRVLVRWESAAPVREAARRPAPPEASEFYIVSISGLPSVGHGPEEAGAGPEPSEPSRVVEEQLKETTVLLRKKKDPLRPARVTVVDQPGSRPALLFFPRDPQPIVPEDKVVTLACDIGPARLSVRFPLKDMLYRGKLEL
jgi:hypothetical protein